jgi:2-polyprenyl-3-methyl-5-hydroxy-6-metoxy-1,4-benzoquinol methylase
MDETVKAEELSEIIREIRDRVRARHPGGATSDAFQILLPDLMPLVHARDAAESKVASIGRVNPRRGGPVNSLVQGFKKLVARALDWHVREQVEFNRHVLSSIQATLEALNDTNRAISELSGRVAELHGMREQIQGEMGDIRSNWAEWRTGWEQKLFLNENQFLRSVADLQGAFQHRVTLIENNFRQMVSAQHADYLGALDRSSDDLQKRLWDALEKGCREHEKLIHEELRIVRQRMSLSAPQTAPAPAAIPEPGSAAPAFDYGRFAERFRGSEDYVTKNNQIYLPYFKDRSGVLDIGCGRGEFLQMMKSAGAGTRGIDLSEESVALCRSRGLDAERADLFDYLPSLPDRSLEGIFCAQVVEHLSPDRLPEMVRLSAMKLRPGGLLAIETPNPECLAIFATHFYLDPTHTRPVPHPLLTFYMEEAGFGRIEVLRLSPAIESMPALAELPQAFRDAFFGGLDYAIFGTKL